MSSAQPVLSPLEQALQLPEGQAVKTPSPAQQPTGNLSPLEQAYAMPDSDQSTLPTTGEITTPEGVKVIVPKQGESFAQTMQRAAAYGKTITPQQISAEMKTAPQKAAEVLAAAPAIGAGGAAALAAPGALYELAVKHLAGNVLPGMEEEAAKARLAELAPKVLKATRDLGLTGAGLATLLKIVFGDSNKK